MDYIYRRNRPRLVVKSTGGQKLGNCFSASHFEVTSTFQLDKQAFDALFETGAIGYGQSYSFELKKVGKDRVPCIGIDGDVIVKNPVNPYSGKPYKPITQEYWVYSVKTLCDSGD